MDADKNVQRAKDELEDAALRLALAYEKPDTDEATARSVFAQVQQASAKLLRTMRNAHPA